MILPATLRPRSPEGWALAAFLAFNAVALVGYGTFGLHPSWLARWPEAAGGYDAAYRLFSAGQILLAFLVFMVPLLRRAGLRWVGAFAAVFALSLASELGGTNYGIPFGGYHYTDRLGYKLLGDVPLLIPISWFYMAIPAWAMGRAALGDRLIPRILLGAWLMTAWDLALDPAMSFLTPFWVWADTGPYYGMPWVNLGGWFLTGLALMAALATLKVDRWLDAIDGRWMAAFYAANVLMPVGMCALAGLGWAVLATLLALGITAWGLSHLPTRAAAEGAAA